MMLANNKRRNMMDLLKGLGLEDLQKWLFGSKSNGEPRSLFDVCNSIFGSRYGWKSKDEDKYGDDAFDLYGNYIDLHSKKKKKKKKKKHDYDFKF